MGLELKFRGDVWYVMGTLNDPTGEKVRVRKSTGFGKQDRAFADAERKRITQEVLAGKWGKVAGEADTLGGAIDLFLTRPTPPGATDANVLTRLKRDLGSRKLAKLSGPELMVWVGGRGNVPGTVAREIASINACLNYSRTLGVQIAEFKLVKPTVDDARTRWLTKVDRDRLIENAGAIRDEVMFLFHTGARLGEMFATTPADLKLDVERPHVVLRSRKGKGSKLKTRHVPIRGALLDRLREKVVGLKPKANVFTPPPPRGGGVWDRSNFYDYWDKALDAAEVEDFTPHDCRHTYASLLIQGGVRERLVADLLGHSTLSLVMRYSHLAPDHLDAAVRALDSVSTRAETSKGVLTHV
jgi:integrase